MTVDCTQYALEKLQTLFQHKENGSSFIADTENERERERDEIKGNISHLAYEFQVNKLRITHICGSGNERLIRMVLLRCQ